MKVRNKLIIALTVLTLLLSACGSASDGDTIATAVAQTVAAQNTLQAAATQTPTVAPTSTLSLAPTLTPPPTKLPPTLPASGGNTACMHASLLYDVTIPDGQIMKPGAQFTKTWKIQNTSSCAWDTRYKIVFWDGDLMGGATYYNFPQYLGPNGQLDLSLLLTAPGTDGTYRSSWMLQTPDGATFGVGEYNVPFYTEIVVSSAENPNYAISNVEFETIRDPQYGCPANVLYTVNAKITTNGPLEFWYSWQQQDGNDSSPKLIKMSGPGTKTLSRSWSFHLAATPGQKWISLTLGYELGKEYKETTYPKQYFSYTCGQ